MTPASGPPSRLHDLLELSSFAATTILLLVGIIALLFTAAQIKEAANTRIATVYLQITDMWNADKAVASRLWLTGLDDKFNDAGHTDAIKAHSTSARDYIRRSIEAEETRDRRSFNEKTFILILLENVGVLCDKGFVSPEVVVAFIGAPIIWQMELLADYVTSLRQTESSAYCHAIALYCAAKRAAG